MDYALLAVEVTVVLFVVGVVYGMGKHSARLESLEKWREGIRIDMHEISDKLEILANAVEKVKTLIEERTERRLVMRDSKE